MTEQHQIRVRPVDGFGRPTRFRPLCGCGWDGLSWPTRGTAVARGSGHTDLMRLKGQGYSREQAEAIIGGRLEP